MIKYGFDYCAKRAETLLEMARPSPLGEKMVGYIQKINQVMRTGGELLDANPKTGEQEMVRIPGIPDTTVQNRRLKYIISTIAEFDNIDIKFDEDQTRYTKSGLKKVGSNKDDASNAALKILGISDETTAGGASGNRLFDMAIKKWVMENPEKVSSREFEEQLTNPQNILFYVKNNRSSSHNTGKLKDERMLAAHGGEANPDLSIEDIHDMSQGIKPLLTKIHKDMGYKKMKLNPEDKVQKTSTGVVNDFTANIQKILQTLEELSVFKKVLDQITSTQVDMGSEDFDQIGVFRKAVQFNQMLEHPLKDAEIASLAILPRDKTGNTIIEDLIEQFSDLQETGISTEDFQNEINDLMSYTPQEVHPILNLILNDITQTENSMSSYPGYDEAILAQYITTPEEKQAFDRYYQWYINDMQSKLEKAKEDFEYSKAGYTEYRGMLPELRRNFSEFLSKWGKINKEKQAAYAKSLRVDDDDDDILKKFNLSPEDIGDDYIASKVSSSKYNESYVMGYMTEQVSKDRFKPKGEFKDRGFKKMNYLQWLDQ